MNMNLFLIQLAITTMVIFGGTFSLRYFINGELLLDQIIGAFVGLILFISALIWRKINKQNQC